LGALWREAIGGITTGLEWSDFDHVAVGRDHIERLIAGALDTGERGVNVRLYGPPGTGKTQFCRTLAERLGITMYSVGDIGTVRHVAALRFQAATGLSVPRTGGAGRVEGPVA